jgi:hypothetical protein
MYRRPRQIRKIDASCFWRHDPYFRFRRRLLYTHSRTPRWSHTMLPIHGWTAVVQWSRIRAYRTMFWPLHRKQTVATWCIILVRCHGELMFSWWLVAISILQHECTIDRHSLYRYRYRHRTDIFSIYRIPLFETSTNSFNMNSQHKLQHEHALTTRWRRFSFIRRTEGCQYAILT